MCDAREKANLDIQSNLIDARQEGRQEGIEIGEQRGEQRGKQRGKLMGSMRVYESLLGDTFTSDNDLSKLSTEALESMVAQLQKRLRDRSS